VKLTSIFQITKTNNSIPKLAVGILLVIFGIGLFVIGFDQGHLFSLVEGTNAFDDLYLHELYHDIVEGTNAFDDLYLHELYHDMRHAAGYPCH